MAEDSAPKQASWFARIRDRDHTRGDLMTSVLALALPSIVASLAGAGAMQLGEMWITGKLGTSALAAVNSASQTFRQLTMLFLMGLQTATQMFIARMVGAAQRGQAEHVAGQSLLAGGTFWVVAALASLFFVDPLARWMSPNDADVAAGIAAFAHITFALLIGPIAIQLGASVLAGAGDATTPMLANFVSAAVMLVAQYALAFGAFGLPELGVRGIALGAGIGSLVGGAMIVVALLGGEGRVRLRREHFRPDLPALKRLLGSSWQPSLHMLARTGILMFFTVFAARLGPEVVAAYGIGVRVEMVAIMIAFPISNACATLVGQNLGAGRIERVWPAVRMSFIATCAALWPCALALLLWREGFVATFTSDPLVAAHATEYLAYTAVLLSFYGLYFVAFRTLQAAGDMLTPMFISVGAAFGAGIPLAVILSSRLDYGATGMWIANLVYAVINAGLMLIWLARGKWLRERTA
ncbi:MAG: MATE family efflux transporter [Deltaproteobacteria bacterium]|nr:MATE family efflux transporter [Deltaproteobacteria bacterium]